MVGQSYRSCLLIIFNWNNDRFNFYENFIPNCEVDVEYCKELHRLQRNIPFSSDKIKINKCKKLKCNLYDKKNQVIHVKALKKVMVLEKVHMVI